jgi:DNA-binding NarL/FixJ family response regulator
MSRARMLLVAVNDDLLDGIVGWVAADDRIEVVGRAHSGSYASERLDETEVDVVLVDVTLPDVSGFELARRIKSRPDAPVVVLLSFHDSQVARHEAEFAGADGFVSMPETAECLLPLVERLLDRRAARVPKQGSFSPTRRVQSTEVSE